LKKKIYLISPRGFCAGVTRAIDIVDIALKKYGKPVYVKHEIVHNKFVIDELKSKGTIFIEDIKDVPKGMPLIFSAHGVSKIVISEAIKKQAKTIDATCPLVTKVHIQASKFDSLGYHIILIGHRNHPEVEGTIGQLSEGKITLVENKLDVAELELDKNQKIAYITQTTLSVDDTKDIIKALKLRYPNIESSPKEDICYATTNRQNAIKKFAGKCDAFIVIGSNNSSNSNRLVEVASNAGCHNSVLLENKDFLDLELYKDANKIGISSGASVPDHLVMDVVKRFKNYFDIDIENLELEKESVSFKLPKELR
jgi:4-hydroxy-3-methylbut-2-enyl diphosphate reductase